MYQEILYEVSDPVATIRLNRPERLNAWTDRMGEEVKHAFAAAERDKSVVGIVLTGAGRGFCAGADLRNLQAISVGERGAREKSELAADPGDPAMGDDFRKNYSYLWSVRKPVIAAINGPCAGMAMPIALFCDLRFAGESASFTTAFVRRGLIAEWGLAWTLPRLVGSAHALDLLLSGRKIDAREAERIGLVNRVLPDEQLVSHCQDYVRELAANSSPASMMVMKRQVYQQLTRELGPSLDEAVKLMVESFSRPDFKEGVQSFLERRPPKFPRV
ncbi:MAG TPA: enoyl-CoA hydratase [Myxococcota bacterium]|nr:enoyl-CoA hydratase [Myxococcota bacterium]